MTQLDPIALDLPVVAPRRHGRLKVPGWFVLLLRNRKSCTGLVMVAFVIVVALIAPLISVAHPNDFNILATRQSPSWNHLFGTTDQGSDIFSQVVVGARRSLLLGFTGRSARHRSRRDPRHHRRVRGRDSRRGRELPDERLSRDSGDSAAHRRLRISQEPRHRDDRAGHRARSLGVRGADPSGPGAPVEEPRFHPRGESLGRVDAAHRVRRADAEHDQPHRGCVRARLLHRAAHRGGARVPRARRRVEDQLGRHDVLGADQLDGAPGRVVAVLLPRRRARVHRARPRPVAGRNRRGEQPTPAHRARGTPAAEGCSS